MNWPLMFESHQRGLGTVRYRTRRSQCDRLNRTVEVLELPETTHIVVDAVANV